MMSLREWFRDAWLADMKAMEARLSDKLDKIKAAEDKLGQDIANAVTVNKSNLDQIAGLIAKQAAGTNSTEDDEALDEILATAQKHAADLEAAFPAPAPVVVTSTVAGATGTDTISGGQGNDTVTSTVSGGASAS